MRGTLKTIFIALMLFGTCSSATEAQILYRSSAFSVERDRVTQGSFTARALSPTEIVSNYDPDGQTSSPSHWRLRSDLLGYPHLRSDYPLLDAIYNMSLEELQKDRRADGTLMAGALWEGVWTRDVSYSVVLSIAAIEPEAAKRSLMAKVKRDRIVQDTGTGGSWPVSSDRMVWALAAWEIYLVTGDRDWLQQSFNIVRNSAADDEHVIFSQTTGLILGESSFLDWREQTYPRWMNAVDIYNAQALGTNAVHYRAYRILACMARALGLPSKSYDQLADQIRSNVKKKLWLQSSGYFSQYLYGRQNLSASPRSESLGESLVILFDIATPEQQDRTFASTPVMEFGVPCIYPITPGIPAYHNNAVWPFVEAFWSMAAAKRHNGTALLQGLASIYRASALFLTNKENFLADTGNFRGTEINSDRQLWSVAGNLATVLRILVGMEFTERGLELHPVVPPELGGMRTLSDVRYRNAILSIRVEGYGATVRSMTIDGKKASSVVPPNLVGKHEVVIRLADDALASPHANLAKPLVVPDTPLVRENAGQLGWGSVLGADEYHIYRNARTVATTHKLSFGLPDSRPAEYQVSAVDAQGRESFLSEPVSVSAPALVVEAETGASTTTTQLTGYSGAGAVELSRNLNTDLVLATSVPHLGKYEIAFRYSNGSGPINTDNKCGIRTLLIDGQTVGSIVMPQRGKDEWSNWGYSSHQVVSLTKGRHTFELRLEPQDDNMNVEVNRVMLDTMELVELNK